MSYVECPSLLYPLLEKLRELEAISVLAIIGSYAKGISTPQSDIDLLLIVNNGFETDSLQTALHQVYGNVTLSTADDVYQATISGTTVSFAVRSKQFICHLKALTIGCLAPVEIRPWVIGGNIPEVLITDIKSSIILIDREGEFGQLSKLLLNGYPKSMKSMAILHLSKELTQKACLVINTENPVLKVIGFYEVLIQYVRIVSLHYNIMNFGIKHYFKRQGGEIGNIINKQYFTSPIVDPVIINTELSNMIREVEVYASEY